jgi:hypothetical protein
MRALTCAGAAALLALATGAAGADDGPLPPGTYRLEMRIAAHTDLPVIGPMETATVSVSRVALRRDGDTVRQSHRVCSTRFEGGLPIVRMLMPARFLAALGEQRYPAELAYTADGWHYRADLGHVRVGLDDAGAGGPLPTEAGDPGVSDWDGDGRPGATLLLSVAGIAEGELYVVQRGRSVLDGRVTGVGQAEGRFETLAFEQRLIGADPGFLARSPRITLDPERISFRLVRVADDTPCATIETAAYVPGVAAEARRAAAAPEAP